jgi:diguanylate cyclase (GGDEF)-like protein
VLVSAKSWNGGHSVPTIQPDDCWGLRRGRTYTFGSNEINFECAHVEGKAVDVYCCIPIVAHGETIGLLHLEFDEKGKHVLEQDLSEALAERQRLGVVCAEQVSLAIANVRLRDQLRDQSIKDPLTGLFNRRYMLETCRREIGRARSSGQCVSLLSIDVDHFKRFNDNHGHDAGDVVLRAVGDCLLSKFREEDIPCRHGGEEFIVILPGLTADAARRRAEELRSAIESMTVRYADTNLPRVTISIGVAAFPDSGSTVQEIVKSADEALYRSKAEGRNRVILAASCENAQEHVRQMPAYEGAEAA